MVSFNQKGNLRTLIFLIYISFVKSNVRFCFLLVLVLKVTLNHNCGCWQSPKSWGHRGALFVYFIGMQSTFNPCPYALYYPVTIQVDLQDDTWVLE